MFRSVSLLAVVASCCAAPVAGAQTAGQITPRTYAPPPMEPGAPLRLPESSSALAPAGADKLEVTLAGVQIAGEPVSADRLAALNTRLTGHVIKVSEIYDAARELEADFVRSGRVLVRVIVPPQELRDGGTLQLTLIEGVIESVDTANVPQRLRRRIDAVMRGLVGIKGLTLAQIDRRVSIAADTPGIRMRSTLVPGSKPGATILVIEAQHQLIAARVSADNTLSEALGRWTGGLAVDFNSVLGAGEQIYLRVNGYPALSGPDGLFKESPRNRALAAGVIVPIGNDGLTLNFEAANSRTSPQPTGPRFASRYQRYAARLRYPFVRSRALTVAGEAGFAAMSERLDIVAPVDLPIYRDTLRLFHAAGEVLSGWEGGRLYARGEVTLGIDGLGARSVADANPLLPLSRQGADADLRKVELSLGLAQRVAQHLVFDLKARAQTGLGDPLLSSQQTGIAASDGISTLDSGSLQGDAGYVVRGEFQLPFAVQGATGAVGITPYAFGAVGAVRLEQPTVLERRDTRAQGYGLGVRFTAAGADDDAFGASLGVEWGRSHRSDTGGRGDRLSFFTTIQF